MVFNKPKEGSAAEERTESAAFERKEDKGKKVSKAEENAESKGFERKEDMIPMDKSKKKPNRKRATY